MKTFVAGDCRPENIFNLVDPAEFSEKQFEVEVIQAFRCIYPEYFCSYFRGEFTFDGVTKRSDLALIRRDFSHWFVVEVELISHSLDDHVLPQIRSLRFGEIEESCVSSICNEFEGFDRKRAALLLHHVPRAVVVVVNRYDQRWEIGLRALDTLLVTVSIYKEPGGRTAREIQGQLSIVQESLGFYKYSAIDRSFRIPLAIVFPRGRIQIEDPFGVLGWWVARENAGYLWITKETGDPAIPHEKYLQMLRAIDGKLSLRLPAI